MASTVNAYHRAVKREVFQLYFGYTQISLQYSVGQVERSSIPSSVSTELRLVTDTDTDGQTERQTTTRAIIASLG